MASATASNNGKAIVPPDATRQASYSGTPRGPDGTSTPDDYAPKMRNPVTRMEIFEEMGQGDDAVRTGIEARRQEICAANWQLSTESTAADATEVLEYTEDAVYPFLDDILRLLGGGAMQYGFGAIEPVLQWSDRPLVSSISRGKVVRATKSGGQRIYLRKVAHLRQTGVYTFRIAGPNDPNGLLPGDLMTIDQEVFDGATFRKRQVPADKSIIWTYDKQGDDYWGVPPTRHCYKAWNYKQQIEKLNLLHIDKFGVGTPVLQEGEGWQQTDRDRAATMLMNWRSGARNYLMYPKGGEIEVVADEGKSTMSILEWVKYYNLAIAKTFLTQMTELGSTETGARALGEVFYDQMGGIVQADVEALANLINNTLIVPLVRYNFGEQDFYPTFAPSQRVRAGSGVASVLQQLISSKAIHPRPEDEAYLRDIFELPPVEVKVLQDEQNARDAQAQMIPGTGDQNIAGNDADGAPSANPPSPSTSSGDAATPPVRIAQGDATPARRATSPAAPAKGPAVKSPDAITQQDVLNGAQISSAKDIVIAVAQGQLPRETGVAMLEVFFNLPHDKAEEIMGAAGTKTPTTPNPIAGAVPAPARVAAHHDHRPRFALAAQLADGAPAPAVYGETSYRTPEFSQWEHGIVRPDVLGRDLDLAAQRVTAEAQDVLRAIDAELTRQVETLAAKGAAALSAGIKGIAAPDRLRKQLRSVLLGAAQRARDYGGKAVMNEIERQIGPSAIGPQRTPMMGFFARLADRVRGLAAGDETSADDIKLEATVDQAVEDEIDRREQSARSAASNALHQAAGALASVLASVASTGAKEALIGLSPYRTQDNIEGVVNTGFGIGRSETARDIASGGGGTTGGGITDANGKTIGIVAKVYSAVMDMGTCDECAKWDGAEFPVDYPEDFTGVQAPNPRCAGGYARCRCVFVYVTDTESVPLVPASKGPQPIRSAA